MTRLESDKTKDIARPISTEEKTVKDGDVSAVHPQHTVTSAKMEMVEELSHDQTMTDPVLDRTLSWGAHTTAIEEREWSDNIRQYPSLDPGTQQAITQEYHILHERVKREGLYKCHYSEYCKEIFRWSLLFSAFLCLLHAKWYLTSACFLGMFWQQIMFTAHDAGHRGISGNFVIDTLIGAFVANLCCGLSIGWWKSSHNVHHLITNMPEHDPDIQNIPLFATSPSFFKSIRSTFYNVTFVWDITADFLVPYQKYTYYPVMAIARFNLLSSLLAPHLLSPSRKSGVRLVDPLRRNCIHGLLLDDLRLLSPLVHPSDLVHPYWIRPDLSLHNDDFTRANHLVPLGYADIRPRAFGIVSTASTPNYHGRGLSRVAGLLAWRIAISGRASSVSKSAET